MDVSAVHALLERHGIQPSAQRVAVAVWVLDTTDHPSADQVFAAVRASQTDVSRATVYNTLNLFVQKGLLRQLLIAEGRVVFDPKLEPHHHFVDDDTGSITDVPWDAVAVEQTAPLPRFTVREMQVVLRGTRA